MRIFGGLADTVHEQHKKIMRQAIACFIVASLDCDEGFLNG
jgi:nicotinic acid mononucleotide adenylyltransferase